VTEEDGLVSFREPAFGGLAQGSHGVSRPYDLPNGGLRASAGCSYVRRGAGRDLALMGLSGNERLCGKSVG
jgi:hypothetical protein